MTESGLKPEGQYEFDSIGDAKAKFEEILRTTKVMKASDLDFAPTDEECRRHLTYLNIIGFKDGDDAEPEYIQTSDGYWLDE